MSTTSSTGGGRPMSVLERARALEAKSSGAMPAAIHKVIKTSRSPSSNFVPSKVGNTAEAGSDGAPQPHSTAAASREETKIVPRTNRYASVTRLLSDADSSTVEPKPAQDVTEWPSSEKTTPANKIPSSSSTNKAHTTKLSLEDKIASDKTKNNRPKTSVKRHCSASSISGKNKLNHSSNTTPAFLSRAVASWNKTEKYFDPLDSDPSSSSDSNGNDDNVSDDDSECSAASTNCTGSTHTSVTNSFTAASSVTSETTGGDTTTGSASGTGTRGSAEKEAGVDLDQSVSSESEGDDDELSGYSGAMSRGSRVGISTRPVSIDSPPQVIRSKMPQHRTPGYGAGPDYLHGHQSSDDETAIHDNTTSSDGATKLRSRSISSSADNSAKIDDDVPSTTSRGVASLSSSSSVASNASADSTKATVTRRPADTTTTTRVVTPDNKMYTTTKMNSPSLNEDDDTTKLKPLWQCRLEDMRLRQKLMKELMHREQNAAAASSTPTISPPRRTKLPAKMHRQVVAGEEDWSKDFANDAFVAFDDDIFGRSEI